MWKQTHKNRSRTAVVEKEQQGGQFQREDFTCTNMHAQPDQLQKKIEQGSSEYKTHRESVNPFSAKDTITLYLYMADSCLLLY